MFIESGIFFIATGIWGSLSYKNPDWKVGLTIYIILMFVSVFLFAYGIKELCF